MLDLSAHDTRDVSGRGTYGIEGAAQRATLTSGGHTIAVLTNGVDRAYPVGHHKLLERVADLGLVVSEVPPSAVPTRDRFLARARLMAALSAATVVVEAGVRSGSIAVARRAHELGHTVGAVPGPVMSATSVGPHLLLRNGSAKLVAYARDIASEVEIGYSTMDLPLGHHPSGLTRSVDARGYSSRAVSGGN